MNITAGSPYPASAGRQREDAGRPQRQADRHGDHDDRQPVPDEQDHRRDDDQADGGDVAHARPRVLRDSAQRMRMPLRSIEAMKPICLPDTSRTTPRSCADWPLCRRPPPRDRRRLRCSCPRYRRRDADCRPCRVKSADEAPIVAPKLTPPTLMCSAGPRSEACRCRRQSPERNRPVPGGMKCALWLQRRQRRHRSPAGQAAPRQSTACCAEAPGGSPGRCLQNAQTVGLI